MAYELNRTQIATLYRIADAGNRVEPEEVHARGVAHPNTVSVLERERYVYRLKDGGVKLTAKGKRRVRREG